VNLGFRFGISKEKIRVLSQKNVSLGEVWPEKTAAAPSAAGRPSPAMRAL
jgi:hypothetical protein